MKITIQGKRLPTIETQRLMLKEISVVDISEDYITWLNNPETTKYLEIRFSPQSREAVEAYVLAKLADTVYTKHFGVYDRNGERLVGTVTLPHIDWNHSFADISFVVGHPEAQGHGYATEAVHGVCYYMFVECGLRKVCGGYYHVHEASARVFAKNGFTVEGRVKKKYVIDDNQYADHILAGLLADEYKAVERYLGQLPPVMTMQDL
jgi:RimJ/RimL family protein N-acetyltransferase